MQCLAQLLDLQTGTFPVAVADWKKAAVLNCCVSLFIEMNCIELYTFVVWGQTTGSY